MIANPSANRLTPEYFSETQTQTHDEYRRHSATVIKGEKVDNDGMVAIIKFS
jgi:leucyl aminopeptidase